MDGVILDKGQRVVFTDSTGKVLRGSVDSQKRGWVMVELDEPVETDMGWKGTRIMLRSHEVKPE